MLWDIIVINYLLITGKELKGKANIIGQEGSLVMPTETLGSQFYRHKN